AVPPRETNVALAATPAVATSANAWATLLAPLAATPAGAPVGPVSTKSLIQIALPNGLVEGPDPVAWYENPPATNWFSSVGAWTISALAPIEPVSALGIAVPEAVPMYLNVNYGNACWNWGPIRFGIRPESETSLVPMTVSVDAVSEL